MRELWLIVSQQAGCYREFNHPWLSMKNNNHFRSLNPTTQKKCKFIFMTSTQSVWFAPFLKNKPIAAKWSYRQDPNVDNLQHWEIEDNLFYTVDKKTTKGAFKHVTNKNRQKWKWLTDLEGDIENCKETNKVTKLIQRAEKGNIDYTYTMPGQHRWEQWRAGLMEKHSSRSQRAKKEKGEVKQDTLNRPWRCKLL